MKTETFIHQEYIEDITVCDMLIDMWKWSLKKQPGIVLDSETGKNAVKPDIKDSWDVSIDLANLDPRMFRYFDQLQTVARNYVEKFKYSREFSSWGIAEGPNIQGYSPGSAFHSWHTERSVAKFPNIGRHLAWMTYLNDVDDAGGTEFYYQGITVQPRKGLTLIWPADWTHTHRGIPSPTQDKWIITGWYSILP